MTSPDTYTLSRLQRMELTIAQQAATIRDLEDRCFRAEAPPPATVPTLHNDPNRITNDELLAIIKATIRFEAACWCTRPCTCEIGVTDAINAINTTLRTPSEKARD